MGMLGGGGEVLPKGNEEASLGYAALRGASGAHRGTLSGRRGGKRRVVAMPLTALRELTLPTQKALTSRDQKTFLWRFRDFFFTIIRAFVRSFG